MSKRKVALVTGGARGNGVQIAKGLASAGATVFLGDVAHDLPEVPYPLSSQETLEEAVASLRAELAAGGAGGPGDPAEAPSIHGLVFDVRDANAVNRAVTDIEAAAGGVDILVNNAGVLVLNPVETVSEEEWSVQMDIIAKGAFLCAKRVLPGMSARGWGRIVNIASVAGHRGIGTGVAYTAAKHALIGLTRSLAMETALQNVTVNAVCPGTVDTALVRGMGPGLQLHEDEVLAQFSERHLKKEPIQSADIAAAACFLASDEAGRINGTSLFVDDGWHAH